MKFNEILNEGRDAPLFHGTGFAAAWFALQENTLADKTYQTLAYLLMTKIPADQEISGVSLTRNKAIAFGFGDIVFEIDQTKLSWNHKLIPFDYWSGRNPKALSKRAQDPNTPGDRYEFEEFCVGAIKNLSKYLIAIHMKERAYFRLKHDYRNERTDILFKHPLLLVNNQPIT